VEASKLKTLYDLAASPDEDVELVGGEIVRRPMTRLSHAVAQGNTRGELHAYTRGAGPGGWLIATDVSVAYEAHECPSHDLAGWRRERLPRLPQGIIDLPPDWVCEIVSPGREKKDTLAMPLLLRRLRPTEVGVPGRRLRSAYPYVGGRGQSPFQNPSSSAKVASGRSQCGMPRWGARVSKRQLGRLAANSGNCSKPM
jgi:hypothetical protein